MQQKRVKYSFVGLLLLLIAGTVVVVMAINDANGSLPLPGQPDDPVTVQLSWLHYGGFGGFYAAVEQGHYAAQDIAVTFQEGGPAIDPITEVLNSKAAFGVASADTVLLARAAGQPVQAIAAIMQQHPAVLVSVAGSGYTRPTDLAGQPVRMTTQISPSFRAMMGNAGVPPTAYEEVVLPSDLALFANGEVPVWGIYFNSFAVTMQQAGYELDFIFPGDYGVDFYGDVIFTTEALIADDPDLVTRFLRATLTGWRTAIEAPDEIGDMVTHYDPEADPALESAKMRATALLAHAGRHHIGWMEATYWQNMAATLRQQGVLPPTYVGDDAYTMTFLHTIYPEQ